MKEWEPEFYDQFSSMQYDTAMMMVDKLIIAENETILDVGCGTGKITYQLAKKNPGSKFVGIDVSIGMVQFALKRYILPNLQFLHVSVTEMVFDNFFDKVISFWTLSWVNDQEGALRRIVSALKPEGIFQLMYPLKHNVYGTIENLTLKEKWTRYFTLPFKPRSFLSEEEYRAIVNNLDLELVIVDKKILKYHFKNSEHMSDSIKSWLAHLEKIPAQFQVDFLKELIEDYKNMTNQEENEYWMSFNVLEINGKKKHSTFKSGIFSKCDEEFYMEDKESFQYAKAKNSSHVLVARL